jgi:hypothetical protein
MQHEGPKLHKYVPRKGLVCRVYHRLIKGWVTFGFAFFTLSDTKTEIKLKIRRKKKVKPSCNMP